MSRYLAIPSAGGEEGSERDVIGAKAADLAAAARNGLRVPPFFVLSLELFRAWRAGGETLPPDLDVEIDEGLAHLARSTGARLGDPATPLLVSVRSGAPISMPGMLDTVLDVGASASVIDGLAARFGDRATALDVRRRFLESFGTIVRRVPRTRLDARAGIRVAARATTPPPPITTAALEAKIAAHEAILRAEGALPEDPREQLRAAIEAVLRSWGTERARDYRRGHGIDDALGTAVIVQAMVFGNAPGASGSGVAFTRHPVTGEKHLFGEFLPNAQGDEVVSGRASPAGLSAAASGRRAAESLERHCPEAFAELERIAMDLEARDGDAQDIELTVEAGTLWILQVRTAKRSPRAAIRIAVDLVREGRIDRADAIARIDPTTLDALLARTLPSDEALEAAGHLPLTIGLPASPGAIAGRVVYEPADAIAAAARNEPAILVRSECSPEDAPGIRAAAGVLTSSGGLTSHAAVIARALGRPCIVAAAELRIMPSGRRAEVRKPAGVVDLLPETITIDGTTGRVFTGELPLTLTFSLPEAREMLEWARELGTPGAWADAVSRLLA